MLAENIFLLHIVLLHISHCIKNIIAYLFNQHISLLKNVIASYTYTPVHAVSTLSLDAESTSQLEDYDVPRTPIRINLEANLLLNSPSATTTHSDRSSLDSQISNSSSSYSAQQQQLYDTPRYSKFFGRQQQQQRLPSPGLSGGSKCATVEEQPAGLYDRPRSALSGIFVAMSIRR